MTRNRKGCSGRIPPPDRRSPTPIETFRIAWPGGPALSSETRCRSGENGIGTARNMEDR